MEVSSNDDNSDYVNQTPLSFNSQPNASPTKLSPQLAQSEYDEELVRQYHETPNDDELSCTEYAQPPDEPFQFPSISPSDEDTESIHSEPSPQDIIGSNLENLNNCNLLPVPKANGCQKLFDKMKTERIEHDNKKLKKIMRITTDAKKTQQHQKQTQSQYLYMIQIPDLDILQLIPRQWISSKLYIGIKG